MVFQLPVVPYPESVPVNGVQAYDPMRPWFFTKTLRFSYGSNKGRPREDWMKDVEKMPGAQMASTLEKYGFGALYLNRKGFPDQGQGLIKQLADAGRSEAIEDSLREQVCILLKPSSTPQLPPPGNRALFKLTHGWMGSANTAGGTQYWVSGDASLTVFNAHTQPAALFDLKCVLGSPQARRITVEVNGRESWNGTLTANTGVPLNLSFDAKPGKNTVVFKTDLHELPRRTTRCRATMWLLICISSRRGNRPIEAPREPLTPRHPFESGRERRPGAANPPRARST